MRPVDALACLFIARAPRAVVVWRKSSRTDPPHVPGADPGGNRRQDHSRKRVSARTSPRNATAVTPRANACFWRNRRKARNERGTGVDIPQEARGASPRTEPSAATVFLPEMCYIVAHRRSRNARWIGNEMSLAKWLYSPRSLLRRFTAVGIVAIAQTLRPRSLRPDAKPAMTEQAREKTPSASCSAASGCRRPASRWQSATTRAAALPAALSCR